LQWVIHSPPLATTAKGRVVLVFIGVCVLRPFNNPIDQGKGQGVLTSSPIGTPQIRWRNPAGNSRFLRVSSIP
jgi:hypothetical protein